MFGYRLFTIVFYFITFTASLSWSASANEQEKPSSEPTSIQVPVKYQPQARSDITIATPNSVAQLHENDINHYFSSEQVTPLLAGPDNFITLIHSEETNSNKGVAILLPDWHQVATNPKGLNNLRQKLPQQGWTVIAIQPSAKPKNYPSQALEKTQRQQDNLATLDRYQEGLNQIMLTVMEKAKNYPGIFMVISEGSHAAILTHLFQQNEQLAPHMLVVLSSYMSNEVADIQYASLLAASSFPVLDLYLKRDHPMAIHSASRRKIQAKKQMKANYRQRQLNNMTPGYYPKQGLLTEINSWLRASGW